MKCCVSPTTSIAADRAPSSAAAPLAQRALQAVLFGTILEPIAKELGPVGDAALGAVVDRAFGLPRS